MCYYYFGGKIEHTKLCLKYTFLYAVLTHLFFLCAPFVHKIDPSIDSYIAASPPIQFSGVGQAEQAQSHPSSSSTSSSECRPEVLEETTAVELIAKAPTVYQHNGNKSEPPVAGGFSS